MAAALPRIRPRIHHGVKVFYYLLNIKTRLPYGDNKMTEQQSYVRHALQSACDKIRNTPAGGRNETLNREAYCIGQLVGADTLDEKNAYDELLGAALQAQLPDDEAKRTIEGALNDGKQNPRDLSEITSYEQKKEQDSEPKTKYAKQLWEESSPLQDSIAETYLRDCRGLKGPFSNDLRVHPGVGHRQSGSSHPALVSRITGGVGLGESVHVTYLKNDGLGKADVAPNKRFLGAVKGGYILLGQLGEHIIVAEGIEKGQACQEATGICAISALSATNMPSIELPSVVKKVTLCGDKGAAGEDAVKKTAQNLARKGLTVRLAFPPDSSDWDELPQETIASLIGDACTCAPEDKNETSLEFDSDFSVESLRQDKSNALISGIFNRGELAVLYSKYGNGKTFLALDIGRAIAARDEWHGHQLNNAPVLYIGLEGQTGLQKRILAAKQEAGDCGNMFARLTTKVSLNRQLGDQGIATILQAAKELEKKSGQKVGLIIFDTLARTMAGDNENEAKDMTNLIENRVGEIQRQTGAAILLVHHTGWNEGHMRGSSALGGAADVIMKIKCEDEDPKPDSVRQVLLEKCKDGEDGTVLLNFKLKVVDLSDDDFDELLTSCVIDPTDAPAQSATKLSGQKRLALQFLNDTLVEYGKPIGPNAHDISPNTRVVEIEKWREECRRRKLANTEDLDSQQKAFKRASEDLRNMGFIAFSHCYVWKVKDDEA